MQTSQDTRITLPAELQSVLDDTFARNRARFGHDAFRMEADGGDSGDSGGDAGDSGDQGGDSGADKGADDVKGDDGKASEGKVEDLPAWAQRIIKDSRDDAARARTTAKTQAAEAARDEVAQTIGKALGLIKDGDKDKVDPAELARQAAAAQETARQTTIELAVFRTAGKHQGDPDALLDSRGFLAKLADLDPTASNFASKVDAAIKQAVQDNPKLKAAQAAGSSSADHGAGGSGEHKARTPKSLTDAVGGHYGT